MTLAPCPCGEVPDELIMFRESSDLAAVYGSCCKEWIIEFRVLDGFGYKECMGLAREAWYAAPRKRSELPEILFDGYAVYSAVNNIAKERISHRVVSDVLDAVVKLIRQGKTDQRSEL